MDYKELNDCAMHQCIIFNYHAENYLWKMATLKICTADGIYGN